MEDKQIKEVVERVLGAIPALRGLKNTDVRSEVDFDGGSIIRVVAHYGSPVPRNEFLPAIHSIRDELHKQGEDRFVILSSSDETAPAQADDAEE